MIPGVVAMKSQYISNRSRPDVAFPLTPALSPRERGNRRQSLDDLLRASLAEALAINLPLPKGEGRGEGEQDALPSISPGATKSSPRTAALVLLTAALTCAQAVGAPQTLRPVVEAEEDIYTYTNANNGSGPMWCHGSTCLVRIGKDVFASGIETLPNIKPLNNCRWTLYQRGKNGWQLQQVDQAGRTREPSPMAGFPDGRLFLVCQPHTHGGGNLRRTGATGNPAVRRPGCESAIRAPAARLGQASQPSRSTPIAASRRTDRAGSLSSSRISATRTLNGLFATGKESGSRRANCPGRTAPSIRSRSLSGSAIRTCC